MAELIDRYWRAANYLTVENMYLKEGLHKLKRIQYGDLKEFVSGHWGTCPGINFIYAHLCRYIKVYHRDVQLIVGPGHAGNALIANCQIELEKNCNEKNDSHFFRTETNPAYPGTLYSGGELGYSLAISFGAAIDNPKRLCVCIIGDGEAETGTVAAAWRCKEFMNQRSGLVLPILHLNGYKMGGPSLFSKQTDNELSDFFGSMGYEPFIVDGRHESMIKALDFAEKLYCMISAGQYARWPMIILKSPKGWTAPEYQNIKIENTLRCHKDPLKGVLPIQKIDYISKWLEQYDKGDLFDQDGKISEEISALLPKMEERICMGHARHHRILLNLPDIMQYGISNMNSSYTYHNITILERYLLEVMSRNTNSFRIVSPDELESNLLGSLKVADNNNRVLEILNENICQAWMQGYIQTGRNCLMISYEAFMPIIASMIEQYAKWIYQANKISWRYKVASATYILTSLCWENTYSHQNPSIVDTLLACQYPFVKVYTPPDANSLLVTLHECLKAENSINLIITSKQKMPQWIDINRAKQAFHNRIIYWDFFKSVNTTPDINIVAAGDYPARECVKAVRLMEEFELRINIRLVFILELTSLGLRDVYPTAICEDSFFNIFGNGPVVFSFHGYPSIIKSLLFGRRYHHKIAILGYRNKSVYSENSIGKLIINGNSRFDIALKAFQYLVEERKIDRKKYEQIKIKIERLRNNDKSGEF